MEIGVQNRNCIYFSTVDAHGVTCTMYCDIDDVPDLINFIKDKAELISNGHIIDDVIVAYVNHNEEIEIKIEEVDTVINNIREAVSKAHEVGRVYDELVSQLQESIKAADVVKTTRAIRELTDHVSQSNIALVAAKNIADILVDMYHKK